MAKKQIKKLTVNQFRNSVEILGIELPDGKYLCEDGSIPDKRYIKEIKQTRVSADIRSAFLAAFDVYMEKKRLEDLRDSTMKRLRETNAVLKDFPNKIQKAKGFLPYHDFVEIFQEALSEKIKREIKQYDYSFSSPYGLSYQDKHLYISREEDIEKYYRGPLVYQEYDGTFMTIPDMEKYKEYKAYIRHCSKPLSVKAKLKEDLYLGDKQWLCYTACYEIPIKKSMTPAYAKELAKKFCQ